MAPAVLRRNGPAPALVALRHKCPASVALRRKGPVPSPALAALRRNGPATAPAALRRKVLAPTCSCGSLAAAGFLASTGGSSKQSLSKSPPSQRHIEMHVSALCGDGAELKKTDESKKIQKSKYVPLRAAGPSHQQKHRCLQQKKPVSVAATEAQAPPSEVATMATTADDFPELMLLPEEWVY
ncbi:hypothetical protein ABZP36_009676 [Zizania latifolia]